MYDYGKHSLHHAPISSSIVKKFKYLPQKRVGHLGYLLPALVSIRVTEYSFLYLCK